MAVINKCRQIQRSLVLVIILLHALITLTFAVNWSFVHSAFIKNGQSLWTVFLKLTDGILLATLVVGGIASSISTIITDSYMVCAT